MKSGDKSPHSKYTVVEMLFALIIMFLVQGISDSSLPGTSTEITGQIRAADRRAQLSAIVIRLERQGALVEQSTADGSGNFRFSRLKRGSYTVVVKMAGYAAAQQTVDLQTVSKAHVLLELIPEESNSTSLSADSSSIDARVPPEARKEYEKGKASWEGRKLNQALEHLDRAVAIYASYFDAQLLRGLSLRELEKWSEAEQALLAALSVRPETSLGLVELGEVYRRTKRADEAEKMLRKAITIDSNGWQGHFTLARVFWETGGTMIQRKALLARLRSIRDTLTLTFSREMLPFVETNLIRQSRNTRHI